MKSWYERIPHPVVLLFLIMVFAMILTWLLPAGAYDTELVEGRNRVIPGSYHEIEASPVGILGLFKAFPLGFATAAPIIFVVLASGIMFGILEESKVIENSVGTLIKKLGLERKYFIVILMTFLYGMLGVAVGYENNIALVPIAAVVSLALGGDLMLAAGISVGAITVGFGLSPINPYTVGTGHKIAELPMFSGAILRSILCFSALSILAWYNLRYFKKILKDKSKSMALGLDTEGMGLSQPLNSYKMSRNNLIVLGIFLLGMGGMLYGIFNHHWFINEISAVFMMIAILAGLAAGMKGRKLSETALKSIAVVAPGAFMVGYATSIKEIMEMGHISDTVTHELSSLLTHFPTYISAFLMSVTQSITNMFIPSGSGQALATLPIMVPLGELLGLTRQTTILAFQIGDGVTNLFNPSLGGLIAMLAMCRVPFDRWLRFILPLVGLVLVVAWVGLLVSVAIGWS
jgi:uncharacterized ion transporter superfamily protein YfcC